jgi:acetyl-CoA acetyltransferase
VESHRRAAARHEAGRFKDQIVPVTLKSKKGDVSFATDEHFRPTPRWKPGQDAPVPSRRTAR